MLADDHHLVRAGIRALLQSIPGIEVVGETGDGRTAVELAAREQPDVLIMDIGMPGLNGIDAADRVTRTAPGVRVMMLSIHSAEEYVLRAFSAGASGYLVKDAAPHELETAVRAVARGETYLSPVVSRHVISGYVRRTSAGGGPAYEKLTPRQREILQLIAEGHTTKDIARLLGLAVKTVATHRTELMQRLDIHEVAGLVRFAIRTGIVSPDHRG